MSQMISRRSDCFQLQAQSEASLGWTGDFLLAFPRALVRTLRRAWTRHADEKLLQELSDHQLRDIGIRREHIPHIVRNGWDI
ncbi:DUF1127 domain-containing protein [Dongia deserti]|uniref:DUF1127 domain-containing protein n=1 Tax=Dongia deserti TaxID=2268030 RepID=UPI0013C4126F|nr:DUF1127 domain-containing protein [Dongia deserti]